MDKLGLSIIQAKEVSQNRKGWRVLVKFITFDLSTEVVKLRNCYWRETGTLSRLRTTRTNASRVRPK